MYENNFIEQLQRIIFEIRRLEHEYMLEQNSNQHKELTVWAINHKSSTENAIETNLFNIVKSYALKKEPQ